MITADLHSHTRYSHGASTPQEMYAAACTAGLKLLGFTEHSPRPLGFDYTNEYREQLSRFMPTYAREVCELLALFADRDRPVGMNMDERVLLDERALKVQRVDTVGDGVQVRHVGNVGKAAVRGSQCAGADGLLIRKTRLSEMHMHVTKAGKNNIFRRIEPGKLSLIHI